ncbi:hypothetical protein DSL72_004176 [Monilinia vaccinii-corymbosi]|uniref:Uncharacterized protein n=1 Tax=Monilinia vaccinii-corymbosi TaxID=61207 RepID=A0A8A3NZU0_9HELO|nr:hypothetical protein DSL72_004176 [Monilinia vaccinii-corymbosi]
MMAALETPTRGGHENLQGVLADAGSCINRQRMLSVAKRPNCEYLSPDSFTTPECAGFKLDYYCSSTPSPQSPYQRLRRNTSTRALRSPSDTSPITPSKLSKVVIAEYELAIKDFDTAPLTMPIRNLFNKKLPPMPILRLGNSPERRGLLDATDLNSTSLQFPILQPNSKMQESAAENHFKQAIPEDLTFVATPSITHNSEAGSDSEIGVADIRTVYNTSTNSKFSHPPTEDNMVSPSVRDTKSSRLRQKSAQGKLASGSKSGKSSKSHLTAPGAADRRVSSSSVQHNGSPLPRNRRARPGLSNGEASLSVDNTTSSEPLAQLSNVEGENGPTQDVIDSLDGKIQGHAGDQVDSNQVAVNSTILSLAHGGPIVRSESQTTIARKTRMSVAPPEKQFARNADLLILGESAPYEKVGSRSYMKGSIEKVEQPRIGRKLSKKVSVSRRKSSLPDSLENKTLKPPVLTLEKKPSTMERFSKPTASSAARSKSAQLQKPGAMASVKNAGKGLKNRLSTIMRTRRASQASVVVASSGAAEAAATSTATATATAVLDTAPELAPSTEELDVGVEFAGVYSQMNNSSEDVTSSGQIVDPAANGTNIGSHPIDSQISGDRTPVPEAEMAAILRVAAATPLPFEDETEIIQSADVQVAAGDGASDPPPNENGNSGHGDEQLPQDPEVSASLLPDHEETLNQMRATLQMVLNDMSSETDHTRRFVLSGVAENLTHMILNINHNTQTILQLQQTQDRMIVDAMVIQEDARKTVAAFRLRANAGIN